MTRRNLRASIVLVCLVMLVGLGSAKGAPFYEGLSKDNSTLRKYMDFLSQTYFPYALPKLNETIGNAPAQHRGDTRMILEGLLRQAWLSTIPAPTSLEELLRSPNLLWIPWDRYPWTEEKGIAVQAGPSVSWDDCRSVDPMGHPENTVFFAVRGSEVTGDPYPEGSVCYAVVVNAWKHDPPFTKHSLLSVPPDPAFLVDEKSKASRLIFLLEQVKRAIKLYIISYAKPPRNLQDLDALMGIRNPAAQPHFDNPLFQQLSQEMIDMVQKYSFTFQPYPEPLEPLPAVVNILGVGAVKPYSLPAIMSPSLLP